MTLCPIALAVGCRKCPAFAICPLKGVIGDQGGTAKPGSGKARDNPSSTTKPKK